ncbi:MAG: hypothetical protein R3C68_13185 [Myxococcota bacterium]
MILSSLLHAGRKDEVIPFGDTVPGVSICEDAWNDKAYWRTARYQQDPINEQVSAGAQLLINLSASLKERKPERRLQLLQARTTP